MQYRPLSFLYTFVFSCIVAGLVACEQKPVPAPKPMSEIRIPADGEKVILPQQDVAIPPVNMPPAIPAQPNPSPQTTPPTSDNPAATEPTTPTKPTKPKVPRFTQQTLPDDGLYLRFLATGEIFYTEIKVEHGILSYTYFEDTQGRCQQWIKSTPCWQPHDLKTISTALPSKDLDNLYTLAKQNGILKLTKETLGGAQQGQRFYAQHLEIRIDKQQKHFIYQHFPGAAKKPEAFAQIETALVEYARDLPH